VAPVRVTLCDPLLRLLIVKGVRLCYLDY